MNLNLLDLVMLDEVANLLLSKCIDSLRANGCYHEELYMAQTICHEQKDNPAVKAKIEEYTSLADSISDGMFSLMLESWAEMKH